VHRVYGATRDQSAGSEQALEEGEAAFPDLVRQHFQYLTDDHGFTIIREHNEEMWAEVVLQSPRCKVRLVRDRCDVFMDIGPRHWFGNRWYDVRDIVRLQDRNITFPRLSGPEAYVQDRQGYLEEKLSQLGPYLSRYCGEMLRGDFSRCRSLTPR
jgi:hypothetical protein